MIPPLAKPRKAIPRPLVPKPKRLLKRKAPMTLVAAFRCMNGGILLIADREENDGYTRREVDKIYRINMLPCQVFLAGSGPGGVLTVAYSRIHGDLVKAFSDGENLLLKHREIIEGSLRHIHEHYAANLENGYLGLIVVFAPLVEGNVPILYRTERSMMIPESYYCAEGSGKAISDYFADRLYQPGRLNKDSMKILAAFILREAERTTAGVGLGADMWFIHEEDKTVHIIPTGVVRELQALIPPIERSLWSDWEDKVKIPRHFSG
jgi:20S proteasome alpha/beta subunit